MNIIVVMCATVVLVAGAHAQTQPRGIQIDFNTLKRWLPGKYTTVMQAKRDSTARPTLMYVVPMWKDSTQSAWYFVEHVSLPDTTNILMHQVWRARMLEEGMFEIAMYTLHPTTSGRGADMFPNAYYEPSILDSLRPSDLVKSRFCEVSMQFGGDQFFGETHGFACKAGAVGSEFIIYSMKIASFGIHFWEKIYADGTVLSSRSLTKPYLFMRE